MTKTGFISAGLAALIALSAPGARAEIVSSAENGFALKHESTIDAPATEVWATLLDPAQWWNGEHTWSGDAANLSLTPYAEGCFCEDWESGSVRHMSVESIIDDTQLTLRGALGPLQSHGVDGALTFLLTEEDGATMLTTTYNVGGYIDGMDQWAGPVDGVIGEQHMRLVRLIETGSPDTE